MKAATPLILAMLTAVPAYAIATDETRKIECHSGDSQVTIQPGENVPVATFKGKHLDYEVEVEAPAISVSDSVHGKAVRVRLPTDNDGTVEHMTLYLSPNILRGPTSPARFTANLGFSRKFLYLDTTPVHSEFVSVSCKDSQPLSGGDSWEGTLVFIDDDYLTVELTNGTVKNLPFGAEEPLVVLNGKEAGLEALPLDVEVDVVTNTQGEILKVTAYTAR